MPGRVQTYNLVICLSRYTIERAVAAIEAQSSAPDDKWTILLDFKWDTFARRIYLRQQLFTMVDLCLSIAYNVLVAPGAMFDASEFPPAPPKPEELALTEDGDGFFRTAFSTATPEQMKQAADIIGRRVEKFFRV